MTRVEATPTPSVLIWARMTAGMSVEVAAQRAAVRVEQLVSWEDGTARPTIPQLRKLASIFHRPLAVFYLPEPPTRFQVMHDFRLLSSENVPPESSPKLSYEIRKAFDRREWTLELMEDMDESPPPFEINASSREGIEQVANRLRMALGVSVAAQSSWRSDNDAFKQWRLLLERCSMRVAFATYMMTM
jgi:transcriptional regulator with XRE-family HTH domain